MSAAAAAPELHGDAPAAASPQGLMDRRELALVAVERTRMPMVVSDPRQPDNPIVLANRAFLDLTGYSPDEVIGRNCRFLQGADTSPLAIAEIRAAVGDERECDVELLNYRKDGTSFWNQLHLSPVHDDAGRLLYFFASQVDASENRRLESLERSEHRLRMEVDHRAKNALAIVDGIVRLSRADNAALYAAAVQRRVQALAQAHNLLAEHGWNDIPLPSLVRSQVQPYGGRRVSLEGPAVPLPGSVVQPLALVFHELAANAAIHGALSRPAGQVDVRWSRNSDDGETVVTWTENGGPAPPEDRPSGFGSAMIQAILVRQLRGQVVQEWPAEGLRAKMTVPVAPAFA